MNKVKQLRLAQGLTRRELAEKANMTEMYLYMIETEKCNPSLKKLEGLSKALNVEIKDIL